MTVPNVLGINELLRREVLAVFSIPFFDSRTSFAAISSLLRPRFPATVPRFVIPIVIYPPKCMARRRSFADIFQKISE